MLAARNAELLKDAQAEIESNGGKAAWLSLDLRKSEAPALLVQKTIEALGGIDIVVNNAGATKRGDFLALSEDDWTDGFALKFFGAVRLVRAAWPILKRQKGSVVNIAGVGGRTPGAQFTIGGSVNAAMLSFTKAMADVGVQDGVQVNAINPGAAEEALSVLPVVAACKALCQRCLCRSHIRAVEGNHQRQMEPARNRQCLNGIKGKMGMNDGWIFSAQPREEISRDGELAI